MLVRADAQAMNELVGAISIYRQEVRPFTDKQIELVTELRRPSRDRHREHASAQRAAQRTDDLFEALEQQTATSEVLKVISGSPGELQPVFSCHAGERDPHMRGEVWPRSRCAKASAFRLVALHNAPPAYAELSGSASL